MRLKADFLFVKCQQQQDAPAHQQAGVLQDEHQPGFLVADVDQGGELKPRRRRELKTPFRRAAVDVAGTHTHHVSQAHVQEKPRREGGDPLLGRQVRGDRQGDVQAGEGAHGAADV